MFRLITATHWSTSSQDVAVKEIFTITDYTASPKDPIQIDRLSTGAK
jgi:hypothetical protein